MKHGIVTNGKNTTLYGDNAVGWVAQRTANNCDTINDAMRVLRGTSSPGYRAQLMSAFGERFKFSQKFLGELAKLDEKQRNAELARKMRRAAEKSATYKIRKSNGASASRCCLCKKSIVKGESYHAGTWEFRAHADCVKIELDKKPPKEAET